MTPTTPTTLPTIQIRQARPDDAAALRRLAALDSAAPLRGTILLAVVDGELRAALSADDGRAVADPFARTADLVELLRTRAQPLGARAGQRRRRPATTVALAR